MSLHETKRELGPYNPAVVVKLFREKSDWYLQVDDNGMGMDDYVVRNYFANVGRSYYRSADFLQDKAKDALDFAPVSQFGIGILSAFMVGDLLTVETRRFSDSATSLSIEIANQGSLFWFNKGIRQIPGTSVRLRLLVNPESLWRNTSG
jgi:HSP90 family molecular chaperone